MSKYSSHQYQLGDSDPIPEGNLYSFPAGIDTKCYVVHPPGEKLFLPYIQCFSFRWKPEESAGSLDVVLLLSSDGENRDYLLNLPKGSNFLVEQSMPGGKIQRLIFHDVNLQEISSGVAVDDIIMEFRCLLSFHGFTLSPLKSSNV